MPSTDSNSPKPPTLFTPATEIYDLGRTRFDHDTAAPSDRDTALTLAAHHSAVLPRTGHAPRGLEAQVHAWNTFQYTTGDVDRAEELKGDLHGGQLHRVNRAARGEDVAGMGVRKGRSVGKGSSDGGSDEDGALCAGRRTEGSGAMPLAKGVAEEMDRDMFWDKPIE